MKTLRNDKISLNGSDYIDSRYPDKGYSNYNQKSK